MLRVISRTLENNGYSTTKAQNGEIALSLIEGRNFDLIITDEHLPGNIKGHDIAEYVKENIPKTPIILMSGNTTAMSLEAFDASAFTVSIMKPVASDKLLQILETILRGSG